MNFYMKLRRKIGHVLWCVLLLGLKNQSVAYCQSDTAETKLEPGYLTSYEQLINIFPENLVATVNNLVLQRDVAVFHFYTGVLYPCRPIDGEVRAFVFKGTGRFNFSPPNEIERKQLARFYSTDSLDEEFTSAVVLFADGTYDSLRSALDFKPDHPSMEYADLAQKAFEFITRKKGQYCEPHVFKPILDNTANHQFWAQLESKEHGKLFFAVDPYADEEISLLREVQGGELHKTAEPICQFQVAAKGRNVAVEDRVHKQIVTIDSYRIQCTIEKGLNLTARCAMEFRSQYDGQRWLYFGLAPALEVDSATWSDGRRMTAFKKKDNPTLWLRCPEPISIGQQCSLTVYYHGDIIERYHDWFYIKSDISWYPKTDYWDRALFDVTFCTPDLYDLVTFAAPCSTAREDERIITRVKTDVPYRNFGFSLGFFKRYTIDDPRIPRINVFYADAARADMKSALLQKGSFLLSGKNMEKQVGADVANSMALYQQLFGPCPLPKFSVTEFPGWGGVAYPGMINLSWSTFIREDEEGYDEMLRAHEVAHQWWGVGVDFSTYHDQWLSEGLATFSGLIYMQKALKDNKKYFQKLETWSNDLLDTRKFLFWSGKKAGPIWLGARNNTSETQGDFDLVVYRKGAWVFHMLRNMMIDLNTMNEDTFIAILKDFYSSYQGKYASTRDFQVIAEKHYGENLDWFFRQWVYDTGIPHYKYAFHYQDEQGKVKAVMRIKQEGVPDKFRMVVPLEIDFGDKRYARLRVTVQEGLSEITLPLLPAIPKKIKFNIFQSVLCTSKEVGWDELN